MSRTVVILIFISIVALMGWTEFSGLEKQPPRSTTPIETAAPQTIKELYAEYKRKQFPNQADLTVDEFLQRPDKENILLIDVRESTEQNISMIPGAITAEEYQQRQTEFSGRPIVAYCTIGSRSGRFAADLSRQGIASYNLIGGILAWAHAEQPLVAADNSTTNRVHVYGPTWDLLPPGYQSVY